MKSVVARLRAVGFTPRVAGFVRRLGVSGLASALLGLAVVRFWTAWIRTRPADIRLLFDFYPSTLTLLAFAFCRRERWLAAAVALGLAIAHMLRVVPSWRGRRGGAAASEASA
jgi:hypothetical protein